MSKPRTIKESQYFIGETVYTWTLTEQDGIYSLSITWVKTKKDSKEIHQSDMCFKPSFSQMKQEVKYVVTGHYESVVEDKDPEEEAKKK